MRKSMRDKGNKGYERETNKHTSGEQEKRLLSIYCKNKKPKGFNRTKIRHLNYALLIFYAWVACGAWGAWGAWGYFGMTWNARFGFLFFLFKMFNCTLDFSPVTTSLQPTLYLLEQFHSNAELDYHFHHFHPHCKTKLHFL
jgi:hypothetical protein